MFIAILFVLASLGSTVITISLGPQFHTCMHNHHYKIIDKKTLDLYAIFGGYILVYIEDIDVREDVKRHAVYAYINSTTIDFSSYAKQVEQSKNSVISLQNRTRNWEFLWKYKGHTGATAQLVKNGLHGYYEMIAGDCEVTTFTIDERWLFKNTSLIHGTTDLPPDWHRVSADVTTAVRQAGLFCLREQVRTTIKKFLQHTLADMEEEKPPVTLKVNVSGSVDRSLIRFRDNIRALNDTIQIPDIQRNITAMINKQIVATGGSFTNLSTIERIGDAVAIIRPHEYNITCTYILRDALIRYDHYSVHSKIATGNGKMFVSIKDMQIQGSRLLSAKDCNVISQHINVKQIGILTYKFDSSSMFHSVVATLGSSYSELWSGDLKKVIKDSLPRALNNAFEYMDTIFGPCMSNSREVGHGSRTFLADYEHRYT